MAIHPASAARKFDDWDQGRVWLAAEHEAAHAVAAHHFSWLVDEIQLYEDGGACYYTPPDSLDPSLAEYQRCVILLTATAFAGEQGGHYDRLEVFQRTRRLADSREEHEYLRRRVEYEAIQLVAEDEFRNAASRVTAALIENQGHLGDRALTLLLGGV